MLGLLAGFRLDAANLLQNPGFESGTTGWQSYGGPTVTWQTGVVHSGARAAYIQNRTATWSGMSQSLLGVLQVSNACRVSAWVRIDGASAQEVKLTMREIDAGATAYINIARETVQPGQWTQLNGGYTLLNVTNLTDLTFYIEGPAAGVNLYADDFVFESYDWKTEANQRIEQIRKRDLAVRVLDPAGYPLPGVQVAARQTRHRFAFGSAVNGNISKPAYAAFFRTNFEWAVMENEAKWYANEPSQGNVTYAAADAITNYCGTNGITLRGHCLFWAVDQHVQSWVTNLSNSALTNAVSNRISSAVSHFKGTFRHWDVNNEMLHGNFFGDRLGNWVNLWMFKQARAIDPNVVLFVNDYNVIAANETSAYLQQVLQLIASNAPVGGIGAQCHFGSAVSPPLTEARIDMLSEAGLPIWVTEYDYASADEYDRAAQLETLYRIAFSKPAVEGILMWGFWAGSHWRGSNAAIVNLDWSLNEAGRRYQSLVREWTTVTNGITGSDGQFAFRGFHGDYDLVLTPPGGPPTLRRVAAEPGSGTQPVVLIINPSDARPVLSGAAMDKANGLFRFCLNGEAGRRFEIQAGNALNGGWTTLATVLNPSGTLFLTNAVSEPRPFYRARLVP